MVQLYGIKLLDESRFIELNSLLCSFMPESSVKKAYRFAFNAGIQRQILSELMVRAIFYRKFDFQNSEIVFEYSLKGKPSLKGFNNIHFNISHSGEWVVCAFSKLPIGVDVEKIRSVNFDIARRFFSGQEVAQLLNLPVQAQTGFFFDLWTLKESYLKAIGTGLTKPLSTFTVDINENEILLYEGDQKVEIYLKKINLDLKHKLSVCSFEPEFPPFLVELFIDDLLNMITT